MTKFVEEDEGSEILKITPIKIDGDEVTFIVDMRTIGGEWVQKIVAVRVNGKATFLSRRTIEVHSV